MIAKNSPNWIRSMSKISFYNHFQPWQDGYYIAYNALTGAVALMTEENYAVYRRLTGKLADPAATALSDAEQELLKQLEYGRFVIPDGTDELAVLKFGHNASRYDRTALGLVIAPTMACNMACAYCFENKSATKMKPDVAAKIVDYVDRQGGTLRTLDVDWYGGEPLLGMDVIANLTASFRELAERHSFRYAASIVTNGYLLTEATAARLVDLGVGHVQVTIDGPARIHNVKRPLKNGKESFAAIIENLQHASDKLSIGVRVNVDKSFTGAIIEELLMELKAAGLQKKVGVYFGMVEPSSQVCANISESCYETADFSAVEIDYYRLLLDHDFVIQKVPSPLATFCMAQNINAHLIDPEGNLYRCWNHVGDLSRSSGRIDQEFDYQDPNFQRLFRLDPFEDPMCRECNLLPTCMGGCPARWADRDMTTSERCEAWKHNLQPMLEIIAKSRQQRQAQQASATPAPAAAKE